MVYTVINQGSNDDNHEHEKESQATKSGLGFWNLDLELQAIKTILTPESNWSAKVYSACKDEFFYHQTTKSIFVRLRKMLEHTNSYELPTLDFVLSDSKIPQSIRKTLREALDDTENPIVIINSQGDYDFLISGLASLAKTRALYQATHAAANELLDSDQPTEITKQITSQLGESLFRLDDDNNISQLIMGKGYNQQAEDTFCRIINGSFEDIKIKSGFKEFDERTGGFHRSNLVIFGGNSGGGKSLMAVNMLVRQFRLGYNVVLASYEMAEDEVLIRLLSNISEIDMNKIQNNKLTPNEIHQVTAAWREFNLIGHEKNNSYNILCPRSETTVPEIGFKVRNLKPDVVILDYINLLAPSSGAQEQQWQALGNIAKDGKLLANKLNCVVILLAQIDETYTLRYSKGIKDHANFVLGWIRDETAINNRIINIRQLKARNAPLYNFDLLERFDIAQFRDPDQTDRIEWPTPDELLMMELQCQSLGLKLEPTLSKEYDKNRLIEARQKQVVNNKEKIKQESAENISSMESITQSLLFSSEDVPIDFASMTVKSNGVSLLKKSALYEDTV